MTKSKPGQRFRYTRRGVVVALESVEREALASVLSQFRQLLFVGTDPNLACLEPPACLDDLDTELEYRAMAANRMLRHRLEAIETVEVGLRGGTLDYDAVSAWMQTINGIRLYLGERLGIGGEPGPEPSGRNEVEADRDEVPADRTDGVLADHDGVLADRTRVAVAQPEDANLVPIYEWLGGLLEQLVEAAAEGLPPGVDDDG